VPLVQHDPGLPLITDEAYALSHTRILQEPSRAAAPASKERRQVTMARKRKNVKSKGGKRHPQSLETIQPNAAFRHNYPRTITPGRLAQGARGADRGHGEHRRILDPVILDP